jgi:hypothetical protein
VDPVDPDPHSDQDPKHWFQGPTVRIFTIFQGPSSLQLNNRRHGGSGPSDDILQSLQQYSRWYRLRHLLGLVMINYNA